MSLVVAGGADTVLAGVRGGVTLDPNFSCDAISGNSFTFLLALLNLPNTDRGVDILADVGLGISFTFLAGTFNIFSDPAEDTMAGLAAGISAIFLIGPRGVTTTSSSLITW